MMPNQAASTKSERMRVGDEALGKACSVCVLRGGTLAKCTRRRVICDDNNTGALELTAHDDVPVAN